MLERFSRFTWVVCTDGQMDSQPDFLQGWDLSRSFSRAQNMNNIKFCENRPNSSRDLRKLCAQTDRWIDNSIFYKVETFQYRFLVLEIDKIRNFVKTMWVSLEIYETRFQGQNDRQTGSRIFYRVETSLDHLLVLEIYVIQNFVKIVRLVLEIVTIYIYNFSSFNNKWGCIHIHKPIYQ